MATLIVYDSSPTPFRRVWGGDVVYSVAREDVGEGPSSNYTVGQQFLTPDYLCMEPLAHFDTSALAGASISSVVLSMYGEVDGSDTDDFTAEARLYDWGGTVTGPDFRKGSELDALTLLATWPSTSYAAAYVDFASEAAFVANINTSGYTRLVVNSDRHRLGTTPTLNEYVRFSVPAGAGTDPKLTITFTVSGIVPVVAGTWAIVTADAAVTIPGSPAVGDRMFVLAAWKAFGTTAQITSPVAWTEVTEFADGAVAAGANVGSVKVGAWYRDFVAGDTAPTVDFSVAPAPGAVVMIVLAKNPGSGWDAPAFATAAIAAADPFTATASFNPGIIAGDLLIALVGLRDDSAIFTTRTLTAAGVTFGTVMEFPATHASTTTSNDIAADIVVALATAGASTAAPVTTGDISASETGAALFIRQRISRVPRSTPYPQMLAH